MQEQIRILLEQGLSIRKVAQALGISRQSIRKYSARMPPAVDAAESAALGWEAAIDWSLVQAEYEKAVSVKQLHCEFAPQVSYWCFRRRLLKRIKPPVAISLRILHEPGERVQVDYCDGIPIVDRTTGKATKTHLFCGVFPFSSYTYGEFVLSQNLPSFLAAQERMWAFFGGVCPYVVTDNLKAGVVKAHYYDPDLNPTYCDFANHYGFAVLPTRPYKPKDKAGIEAAIGAIQRSFFQEVRLRTFYSLGELNSAFREFLARFNTETMKDYGQSRVARFEPERAVLRPLPVTRFELAQWRGAKVHPDCHVQVHKNYYSVPHSAVGQTVRVRITEQLVEIFTSDHSPLAAHHRLSGVGQFATEPQHYPAEKQSVQRFEIRTACANAERIGIKTNELVRSLVSVSHPLRHLRRIQGILRLHSSGQVTTEALEYAAEMALRFKKQRLSYIKACAEHFRAHGARPGLLRPERAEQEIYLHKRDEGAHA